MIKTIIRTIQQYLSLTVILIYSTLNQTAFALSITEDFTGIKTNNAWLMPPTGSTSKINTACLTAGINANATPTATKAGSPPRCHRGNDPAGKGALRLTANEGWQVGGIVSNFIFPTNDGVDLTFTTYSFGGNGADGMSFLLLDGSKAASLGASGGSLGYSCTNVRANDNGVMGGYIGLGIDEWGNFINKTDNTSTGFGSVNGDNSATNFANSIGIRGAGSINHNYFADPNQFLQTVWNQNQWGKLPAHIAQKWQDYWADFSSQPSNVDGNGNNWTIANICRSGTFTIPSNYTATGENKYLWSYDAKQPENLQPPLASRIYNYPYLAHVTLKKQLYTPYVRSRLEAIPLTYKLRITPNGKLSVWFSYNGGIWQPIMTDEDIVSTNGPLPSSFRFGFVGSTGGYNNNHDVTCFKASPADSSEGSVATNLPDEIHKTDAQIYLASYNSLYWKGNLIAKSVIVDNQGNAFIQPLANWDSGCNLTGGECVNTGRPVSAQQPHERTFWSWNGSKGISLLWDQLTPQQQNALKNTNETEEISKARLAFLKGDRSREGVGNSSERFRERVGILGDIINSSPVWVGYPDNKAYQIYAGYPEFKTQYKTRTNMVYIGANDGFLHAFRSGAYDLNNHFVSTLNDGKELFSYMPAAVLSKIHQQTEPALSYSSPQYAHNFYVDATPASGDVYYDNSWHTWLLGGLGFGGSTIYALDITNPNQFSAENIIGEWSYIRNDKVFGNMKNTHGTPEFAVFTNQESSDGKAWGAVFGNGWCSSIDEENGNCSATSAPAGIYVMSIHPQTGSPSFQFLSTDSFGSGNTPNGIAYTTPFDVNNDGIIDYVYAGDLKGQVWRFNLHTNQANWSKIKPTLIFKAESADGQAQPISTKILVSRKNGKIILNFGTGLKQEGYLHQASSFAKGTQSIYGIIDKSALSSLTTNASNTIRPMTRQELQQQTINPQTNTISQHKPDWNTTSGWYIDLPIINTSHHSEYEQIIWNPVLKGNALVVNSYINSSNAVISCETSQSSGYSYALNQITGAGLHNFWQDPNLVNSDSPSRVQLGTTGSGEFIRIGNHLYYVVKDKSGNTTLQQVWLSDGLVYLRRLAWREINSMNYK